METGIDSYLEMLSLIAFFAGYPVIFMLVVFFAEQTKQRVPLFIQLKKLLPYAYALVGSLYFGFVGWNLYLQYNTTGQFTSFSYPYLQYWAFTAVLCWLPVLSRKLYLSLLHSLIFFFILLRDFYLYATDQVGKPLILTDMKLYTDSLLLNAGCLFLIYIIYRLARKFLHN